ncbi:MAG: tartrate dehydrogenase, partial [Planctomycetaceae bacterium]|nr:tartrate dehydrogenase [Planctomycetaceae bacterium]
MKFKIALYPGDGIGPDVLTQAERVMYRVGELQGIAFDCTTFNWGMDHWSKHGQLVPADFLAQLKGMDA